MKLIDSLPSSRAGLLSYVLVFLVAAFAPMIEGGTTNLPVFLLKILVLSLLSLYFFSCLKEGRFIFPWTPMDLPVAAFLAMSLLSLIIAPYKYMALVWAYLIFTYAAYFYLSNWAFRGRSQVMYVAVFIMAMGALESAVGMAQWVSGSGRVHGTFFNPNMLAGYLGVAALAALALIVFNGRPRLGKATTALLAALSMLFLSVLFLTGSRGGVLAFSAGLAVILIARYRIWAAVTVAAFLAAVLLIPNPVRDRAFSSSDPYAYSRADIWKSAAKMTADHPMGVGLGNFKYYWPRYNFPVDKAVIKYGKVADTAHNEYLHMAAEAGVPALVAFLIIIGVLFVVIRKNADDEETEKNKGAYLGLVAGGTALLVHAAVDSNLHEPGIVFLLLLMVSGLISKQGHAEKQRETVQDQKAGKRLGVLFSLFILLLAIESGRPAAAYYFSVKSAEALKASRSDEPLKLIDRSIFLEGGNAAYHNQRASLLFAEYKEGGSTALLQDALVELDTARRLNPNDARHSYRMAWLKYSYSVGKDKAKAEPALQSALSDIVKASEANPYGADILYLKARIEETLGNRTAAVSDLVWLKAIEPNYFKGRLALARLYRENGDTVLSGMEFSGMISDRERLMKEGLTKAEKDFIRLDPAELEAFRKEPGKPN